MKSLSGRGICIPTFIAALITIAKIWKPSKCSLTDEWIRKMWYIDVYVEYHKKEENPAILTAWINLEGIMLSDISQTEKDKYYMISLICGI